MDYIVSAALLFGGIALLAALRLYFNRTAAPLWTRGFGAVEFSAILITALVAAGVGALGEAVLRDGEPIAFAKAAAVVAVVVLAGIGIWRALKAAFGVRLDFAGGEPPMAEVIEMPIASAMDPSERPLGPDKPVRPSGPARPERRRAA